MCIPGHWHCSEEGESGAGDSRAGGDGNQNGESGLLHVDPAS